MSTLHFRNATILDGTGAAPFTGDVLVDGNRIADVIARRPAVAPAATGRDGGRLPRRDADARASSSRTRT